MRLNKINLTIVHYLLTYKIRINFRDFCKIPLQIKGKLLYYILFNKNNIIFPQIFLNFQKNSLVNLTK